MRRGQRLWQRLTEDADLSEEIMPGQTIVELAGDNRVLIEGHMGVKGYSHEKIVIQVKFGCIHVCGTCLELCRMSAQQLIIRGKIDQITLQRRA